VRIWRRNSCLVCCGLLACPAFGSDLCPRKPGAISDHGVGKEHPPLKNVPSTYIPRSAPGTRLPRLPADIISHHVTSAIVKRLNIHVSIAYSSPTRTPTPHVRYCTAENADARVKSLNMQVITIDCARVMLQRPYTSPRSSLSSSKRSLRKQDLAP